MEEPGETVNEIYLQYVFFDLQKYTITFLLVILIATFLFIFLEITVDHKSFYGFIYWALSHYIHSIENTFKCDTCWESASLSMKARANKV